MSCLALLTFIVFAWSQWYGQSEEVLHRGWEITREKFSQGASFADDMFDQVHFLKHPSPTSVKAFSSNNSSIENSTANAAPDTVPEGARLIMTTEEVTTEMTTTDVTATTQEQQEDSPYAYVFYATEDSYACSVLVNIERLQKSFHTRHRIFVLASNKISASYIRAYEERNVTVSIQTPPAIAEGSSPYYQGCLLKLLAFKMHLVDPSLEKVISLDSDQLIMQNLDHLFELPIEVDLAAPRAYWIARDVISSTFMLITLSDRLWSKIEYAIKNIKIDKYDMDIVQDVLGDTVMMLPGQYVAPNSHWEDWNLPNWFHAEHTAAKIAQGTVPNDLSAAVSLSSSDGGVNKRQVLDVETIRIAREKARITTDSTASNEVADMSTAKEQSRPKEQSEARKQSGSQSQTDTFRSDQAADISVTKDRSDRSTNKDKHVNISHFEEEQANGSSGDIFDYLDSPSENGNDARTKSGLGFPGGDNDKETKPESTSSDSDSNVVHNGHGRLEERPNTPIDFKHRHASLAEMQKQPPFKDLYELYPAVSVLHFFALGKPWSYTLGEVTEQRPGAHPLFVEQFRLWRQTALDVCPPGILDEL